MRTPGSWPSTPPPRRRCPAWSPSSPARTSPTTRSRWPGRPAARPASRTTSTRHARWPRTMSSGRARGSPPWSPKRPRSPRTRSSTSTSPGSRCRPSWTPRRPPRTAHRSSTRTRPNNVVFDWTVGDLAGTDAALAAAPTPSSASASSTSASSPTPMETRGDIGWYNPGTDEYTIWMSSQTPHIQRLLVAIFTMGIPEHKLRCISPDVGGAFGSKIFCYADYILVLHASKAIGGRPVKWVEGRRENYQATIHGRDHITYIEVAAQPDGVVTGLKVKTYANLGGRLSTIGPGIPTTLYARVLSGPYKIPNVYCEVIGVYTNTVFTDAYRGAGRPEATYVVERAMDLVADELGIDPAEVRRRNFLPPDSFPYANPSGLYKASGGAEIFIDSGQLRAGPRQGPGPRRLRRPGRSQGGGEGARQAARRRAVDLPRDLRRGAIEVDRRRRRGLGRGDVGVGQHQGPPDRQGRADHRDPAAGPGPRDDLLADRRLAARHRRRRRHRPALRHAGHADGLRLVRQPHGRRRRHGGHQGARQDPGQGQALRRAHARGLARRHRDRRRELPGQGLARQGQDVPGDRLRHRPRLQPAGGHGAVSRRDRLLRHPELHLAVRHPHRDGRGRRGDRARSTWCASSPSTTAATRSTP